MDKCDTKYKPQVYQSKRRVRTDVITVKMNINQETDNLVETEINIIEVEEVLAELID